MKLSIVTTLYYSAPHIEEFYSRITAAAQKITDDYEIIFVNDGSPDNSLEIVLNFFEKDKKIKIIDLSRNFGHHKAFVTGISQSTGDFVFLIDCDLEEDPEYLKIFCDEIVQNPEYDVIYGQQKLRKGGLFEKFSGELLFNIINALSDVKIPKNITTMRVLSRRYVDSLKKYREKEVYLGGIYSLVGYQQKPICINKRDKGKSTYTLSKKMDMAINAVVSFSNKPLYYIYNLGLIMMGVSLLFIIYLIIKKLFFDITIGWTSLIVSVWFLQGLTLLCLGVVGIYISKIFIETKERPYTIIKEIHSHEGNVNEKKYAG